MTIGYNVTGPYLKDNISDDELGQLLARVSAKTPELLADAKLILSDKALTAVFDPFRRGIMGISNGDFSRIQGGMLFASTEADRLLKEGSPSMDQNKATFIKSTMQGLILGLPDWDYQKNKQAQQEDGQEVKNKKEKDASRFVPDIIASQNDLMNRAKKIVEASKGTVKIDRQRLFDSCYTAVTYQNPYAADDKNVREYNFLDAEKIKANMSNLLRFQATRNPKYIEEYQPQLEEIKEVVFEEANQNDLEFVYNSIKNKLSGEQFTYTKKNIIKVYRMVENLHPDTQEGLVQMTKQVMARLAAVQEQRAEKIVTTASAPEMAPAAPKEVNNGREL